MLHTHLQEYDKESEYVKEFACNLCAGGGDVHESSRFGA